MKKRLSLIATCTFGLEGILKQELSDLGYTDLRPENGKVEFEGNICDIARANISLRTADRILVKIGAFTSVTFDELYEKTKALPWEEWIGPMDMFPVSKATSVKSKLFSKSDCQSIVKKAVVDRLTKAYKIQWFEENRERFPIHVNILKDEVTLSIDASGSGLHKRGYRAKGNEAPIKETLAAAIVYLSKWNAKKILVDPFCGSGTLLIEAAMIAADIMPGNDRDFSSEHWSSELKECYRIVREESAAAQKTVETRIFGFDIDRDSISIAKENARLAGVDKMIEFNVRDARDVYFEEAHGVIITNPPYGDRLMTKKQAEMLYRDMGKSFRKLEDWSFNVITSHLEFERYFGQRSTKNRKLYSGNLLTYLYQFMPGVRKGK
ncbi:MAG: class I SAM-dependent RNA methyltransferase [Eubacteriaceae bacterium]|nr:class I SAM-dependent RNA methyltransferase [Eubacteriaceae bacterium]